LIRWLHDHRPPASSDFQLLSRRAVEGLQRLPEAHRYLRGLVAWLGLPTTTLPYEAAARPAGRSKFGLRKLTGLAADGVLSFSALPLRLALVLGLVLVGLGVVAGVAAACGAFAIGGWSALAVLELVLAGLVLCGVGVVGEYVGRIYEQVKGRPIYLLKEASPELTAAATSRQRRAA
jgi:dolichol-phosphate mannosyltransferase